MTYTFDQIRELVQQMETDQGPVLAKMRDILVRYEGDWVVPLPSVKTEPILPQLTPALIGEAIDQIALRASSVDPRINCPAVDHTRERGVRSQEYGRIRERALTATLDASRWSLGMRRLMRHLTAYHTGAIVVEPDMKTGMPRVEVRDPMFTYTEPKAAESLRDPAYVCFIKQLSGHAIRTRWPQACSERGGPVTDQDRAKLWRVVEWWDDEEQVYGILDAVEQYGAHIAGGVGRRYAGDPQIGSSTIGAYGTPCWLELERLPNRAGMVPAVAPHNVSLGRIASRIGALTGNVDLQGQLMALHILAQEKAIFPDVYAIGRQSASPSIVGGKWRDGREGEINLLRDVEQVGVLRTSPDPATGQMVDRLERNFRTSTSLVPQLGGETYGALRTGRGIDALSGMALDPRVQELHQILEAYLPTVNRAVLATYKGYWGRKSYSMYTGQRQNRTIVEFTPNTHFETYENGVVYPIPGADTIQLTQILGSLHGAGMLSLESAQEKHPLIGDPDAENRQMQQEELAKAALAGIAQQIAQGALPATIAAKLRDRIRKGMDLLDAIEKVDEDLRKLQATAAPEAPEGMVAPPEAMPGMTGGPAADQQPIPQSAPNVEVPPDVTRMRQLMTAMGAR